MDNKEAKPGASPPEPTESQFRFRADLDMVLHEIRSMLIEKNNLYGDASLNPSNTFSKGSARDLIAVRIDDKLSRIKNNNNGDTQDPRKDLLGYLVLDRIAELREGKLPA